MNVIFNGALVPIEQSNCTKKGWLTGAGIFETIKTVDGKPWALSRHMRRAVNSSAKGNFPLPNEEVVREAIKTLLDAEHHRIGMLRLSFDSSGQWAAVHLPYSEIQTAAKVTIHPEQLNINGAPIKSYPYTHRIEILERAASQGFDEALVINSDGKVCEGAVTNLLAKINGIWCTPPLSDGVLAGVMRALVIENFDVVVRSIAASDIDDIDSAFLLSSLRIAQPIGSINGRELSQSLDFGSEIRAMALRTSVG